MEEQSLATRSADTDGDHPPRFRTMTGSSMGSFSSYLEEKDVPQLMVGTSHHQHDSGPVQISPDSREENLEEELEVARWERNEALETLRHLAQGMRLVTRQIKQSHSHAAGFVSEEDQGSVASTRSSNNEESQQNQIPSCSSSFQSHGSDYDQKILIISHQLEGTEVGVDLMSLSHAAHMVNENVRLVSREASDLVQDVQAAHKSEQTATNRAEKAERLVKRLYKENKSLEKQVERLNAERKVLKREVKILRSEQAKSQLQEGLALRSGMLRAVEEYVAGALQIHEQQLTKAKVAQPEIGKETPSDDITKDIQENYVAGDARPGIIETISDENLSMNDTSFDTVPTRNASGKNYIEEKKDGDVQWSKQSASRETGSRGVKKSWTTAALSRPPQRSQCKAHKIAGVARAVSPSIKTNSPSQKRNYKPLTFGTPTERGRRVSPVMSSKHGEEKLGSRVKNFFSMSHHEPDTHEVHQKEGSLLKLDDESIERADTKDGFDLPPSLCGSSSTEHDVAFGLDSPVETESHDDFVVTFDSRHMNEHELAPADTPGDSGSGAVLSARSVTVSFDDHIDVLRSLALPRSETPLTMEDDELYEC